MSEMKPNQILCRFKSETGDVIEGLLDLPIDVSVDNLQRMCTALLNKEEDTPYLFFVNEKEITSTLSSVLDKDDFNSENIVDIVYQQQAVFRVRPVTRCTSSLPGHAESVLSAVFSPDSKCLATGSGDTTVRFWDLNTQTPLYTAQGHKHWVLALAWSPDATRLASADKSGIIALWDPGSGKQCGKFLQGHKKWITHLAWEPYHRNPSCRILASSSKDNDVRIWDTVLCQCLRVLSSHCKSVTFVKWGGAGLIYSASQDRTIKVWRSEDGVLCRSLEGHAHWVNTLALNTDWLLKLGPFDPVNPNRLTQSEASERYKSVCPDGERLVSGSDDFTLFLWSPEASNKPLARLTGHQQVVNDVKFSPDGRLCASASFDKSIRIWDGRNGKFLAVLRGHVQGVYVVAWSSDSRLLLSGSADSTLKVWNVKNKKLDTELPGHADEVYAVDWSVDGLKVASGGKDKLVRL